MTNIVANEFFRSFALTVSPASEQAISRKLLRYCCGTPYAGRDRDTVGSVLGLLPPWFRDDTPVPKTAGIKLGYVGQSNRNYPI